MWKSDMYWILSLHWPAQVKCAPVSAGVVGKGGREAFWRSRGDHIGCRISKGVGSAVAVLHRILGYVPAK